MDISMTVNKFALLSYALPQYLVKHLCRVDLMLAIGNRSLDTFLANLWLHDGITGVLTSLTC